MKKVPVLGIVKIVLGIFFVAIGLFYAIYPESIDIVAPPITRILGLLFFVRGAFRIYTVYKSDFKDEF